MNKWHDHLMEVAREVVDLKNKYNPDGEITFEGILPTKIDDCMVHSHSDGGWSVQFGFFIDGGVTIINNGIISLSISENLEKSSGIATKLADEFLAKLKEATDEIPEEKAKAVRNRRLDELKAEIAILEAYGGK